MIFKVSSDIKFVMAPMSLRAKNKKARIVRERKGYFCKIYESITDNTRRCTLFINYESKQK